MGHDRAVPIGVDPSRLARALHDAHDSFVSTGDVHPALRSLVLDSWRRSVGDGVDPEHQLAPIRLDDAALADVRAAHPLRTVMPVIRRLLTDSATDAGLMVAVSDAVGQLLWVEGDPVLRARAEATHFVAGADWSEGAIGTNAPGTALALGEAVQIFGPEHLSRPVASWSCSASPIRDPDTGAVLGVLDLSGGPDVVSLSSVGLVRATVAAVEAQLRIERLTPTRPRARASGSRSRPRIDVLGTHAAAVQHWGTTTRLTLRHSELVLLLAMSADGLTAGQLAVALSEDELPEVTIRAELSRLRTVLTPLELLSRPYRFGEEVDTDVVRLRRLLASGALRRAVALYRGPVLPMSQAPAVEQLRDDLHLQLRSALLGADDADALLAFADTPHGRYDLEVWERGLECLPASSPRRFQVEEHVRALEVEHGL
ncbi:sigma-54-dependent transcriptional regulator family protein [Auraticoccus monumenti]|uniref:GAF domain-containing protein n=1 Tax=Auraticoccus monumenti TaxID=675864 RepID=A0A1G6V6F4_9ACTN|nr:transcriptional regulator [Auraticoccus monumenti]SDD49014.1 hypothetical protein SAMN04489747_1055 [Auraticoccus monumenti]